MAGPYDSEDDIDDDDEVGRAPDDDEDWDEDEDEDEVKGASGKRKILLIAGLFVLLVSGGTAAAYFTGLLDPILRSALGARR
ncbi:MAG: hypothetical protein QGI63_08575 [Rhodospirillales bacterium]|nr:hypothetical protein [Rhodospirillales bacterium]MDP6774310.1 hypothetical protein [Rhodospirillales bacterium]